MQSQCTADSFVVKACVCCRMQAEPQPELHYKHVLPWITELYLYRYILWEAEDAGLELPFACRMGCCTACAVRVKSGAVWQPEALGISRELKDKNFALMCVGFPQSDVELETVEEDELYMEQFGKPFAELAVDKDSIFIDRDDFALELAEMDE